MKTGYMKKKKKQNSFIVENGAIYIFKYKDFNKFNNRLFGKIGYSLMSKNNSLEIDYPEDIKTFKHYIYCKK
jgi:CMP-N-acetylneuraminic acid synthetase